MNVDLVEMSSVGLQDLDARETDGSFRRGRKPKC
jgi:hypothetical protein